MIRFNAILDEATKASTLLFTHGALDLVAASDAFAKILEFVFFVQEYFRGPESTKFVNVGVLMRYFDRPVDGPTLYSHVLILAQASAEGTDLQF